MKSKELKDTITKYSARFVNEVAAFNSQDNYDINIHSESFLIPILSKAFDLNLVDLNNERKNFPALDLGDYHNRVGFQITVSDGNEKVLSTLNTFYRHSLYEHFDKIYIFILKQKRGKVNIAKINEVVDERLEFDPMYHILDFSDLLLKMSDHSLQKLSYYARIFKQQFSDIQLESRKKRFKDGYLSSQPEYIFSNLMPIEYPNTIYTADLSLDEESILARWNENLPDGKRKPYSQIIKKAKALGSELRHKGIYRKDWVVYNKRLWTFSNLGSNNNELHEFVDIGTIEEMKVEELNDNNDQLRVFKTLLRNSLIEDCSKNKLEFVPKGNLIRFRLPRGYESDYKVRWKAKNYATKTVIKKIVNKKEGHVVCYRHLAFIPRFECFDKQWYLIIRSTWSFTNPGGKKVSRFQDKYLSGIKRLERNPQIYYFNWFWNYYLKYQDLFSNGLKILQIKPIKDFSFNPSLVDSKWLPVKNEVEISVDEITIEIDNEVTPKLF